MTQSVKSNSDVLKFLCKAKPQHRRAILKVADKKLVSCICECVHNILNGNIPLTKNQKNKLYAHKKTLRKINKKGDTFKVKKKIIEQKGSGFLPLILVPILTAVLEKVLH